ncbi:MAG: hypothetical protein HW391_2118 [Chloroflexi bacterium]|nr:hypothetical protein [Chloroflexota bacterium]
MPDPDPLPSPVAGASLEAASVEGDVLLVLPDPLPDDRSFFAQPEPLKWNVGVVNPLRIVPSAPQAGHLAGPVAWIPWITSLPCPQRAQA